MNNSELAHHFIYDSSATQASNFSCNNNSLFSFSSLMATIDREKKIILIDERISTYSNSSHKHRNHFLRAIPSIYSVFEWYWRDGSFIYEQYNKILLLLSKQSRARKVDYSDKVERLIDLSIEYSELFKENIKESDLIMLEELKQINIQELLSSSKDLIESNKQRLLAIKTKENEEKQESRQKDLNKFLGHNNLIFDPNYNSVYLKIIEDKLYTSNHVTVNLYQAITLYKAYLSGKKIIGATLGNYVVGKSSKESVTIGCTTISAIELNRVLSEYL